MRSSETAVASRSRVDVVVVGEGELLDYSVVAPAVGARDLIVRQNRVRDGDQFPRGRLHARDAQRDGLDAPLAAVPLDIVAHVELPVEDERGPHEEPSTSRTITTPSRNHPNRVTSGR